MQPRTTTSTTAARAQTLQRSLADLNFDAERTSALDRDANSGTRLGAVRATQKQPSDVGGVHETTLSHLHDADLRQQIEHKGVCNAHVCETESERAILQLQRTSEVEPKRFFVHRRSLCDIDGSASMIRHASTKCSSVRGPAASPALFTCPVTHTGTFFAFAHCIRRHAQS